MDNIKKPGNVFFKHVLRTQHKDADSLANKVVEWRVVMVKENHEIYEQAIP